MHNCFIVVLVCVWRLLLSVVHSVFCTLCAQTVVLEILVKRHFSTFFSLF